MIRFFISTDSGTTKQFNIMEDNRVTASATVPVSSNTDFLKMREFMMNGLVLQASAILYASTNNANV
jgi:hypothetical protein